MPCRGKKWEWATRGDRRVFPLLQEGGRWLAGYIGRSDKAWENNDVDNDINCFRGCALAHEIQGRTLARGSILNA
eukprot:11218762-Lingulodinium_polyedra.AAC.1